MRVSGIRSRVALLCGATAILGGISLAANPLTAQAAVVTSQTDVVGPAGSGRFGERVTVLPNGNYIVVDPFFDLLAVGAAPAVVDAGAVFLYNGKTNALISVVTGSHANDSVGQNIRTLGVSGDPLNEDTLLAASTPTPSDVSSTLTGRASAAISFSGSGQTYAEGPNPNNFVIVSPYWDNGMVNNAGAVTWVNGDTGLNGEVSATNSLVGSSANDVVGNYNVEVLTNGNYVVRSGYWSAYSGAVTWGNGMTGITGVVSSANSLVGANPNDFVSNYGVRPLPNGNYVVRSGSWNGNRGAVTWGNGATGTTGVVSASNSLVGSSADDVVGSNLQVLPNGNYAVVSSNWDGPLGVSNVGAVTLGNGSTGTSGVVSAANSLVGSSPNDNIGYYGVRSLGFPRDSYGNDLRSDLASTASNFVVVSPRWTNEAATNAGAVTWVDGTVGTTGVVSAANSLVGTTNDDRVGDDVAVLANGNYVVNSTAWGADDLGAATWGNGATGTVGAVSAANSLVGTSPDDVIGAIGITVLSNGNYVVRSPYVDGAATDTGAATWGNGATAGPRTVGPVTAANSLVGSSAFDNVSGRGVTALPNGNYVVVSSEWQVAGDYLGAATFALGDNGAARTVGPVSAANSLIGAVDGDYVGNRGVEVLANGNYLVLSAYWHNGAAANAGAITWGNGTTGRIGVVSATNSIVGSSADDYVGTNVTTLQNGNFVASSSSWDNGTAADSGAVTWGNGATGSIVGEVASTNSLVGSSAGDNVGGHGVTELKNGNYVVNSPSWTNGTAANSGAVTWGNGATGVTGIVSAANSLIGTTAGDEIGEYGVWPLSNGNYVVDSNRWDNGAVVDAGAVTWGNGTTGVVGAVSAVNSLVGSTNDDRVGDYNFGSTGLITSPDGSYLVVSDSWDNGAVANAGAVTYGAPGAGVSGVVTATNSAIGTPLTVGDPGLVLTAASGRTTANAVPVLTSQNRVLLLQIPADFVPLTPGRLADTRATGTTVDNLFAKTGVQGAGTTMELTVGGRSGVPSDAAAVSLNVTSADPAGDGYVTVFPCGSAQPNSSNVNYVAGSNAANGVVAKMGLGGKVCLYTSAATHLVVDVNGSFPVSTSLVSMNPARVLDTRPLGTTADGIGKAGGVVAAGSTTTLPIAGRVGVPGDAKAVVLNVTAANPGDAGFLTVYPCGTPAPLSSNLNYGEGTTVANLVISKVGVGGAVCIFSQSPTDLIVDLAGYFPAGSSYVPLDPARLLETRSGSSTIDGAFNGVGLRAAATTTELVVGGRGGVPASAATVTLNVTSVGSTAQGFVTVYPCDVARPLTSNLNFATGVTVANAVMSKVGAGGKVCLFNSDPTHLIVDVNGYLAS
jgi:trimeric autotransporter adhesin